MNRRRFLGASLSSLALAACAGRSSLVLAQCAPRTEPNIEGPFYTPGAPLTDALGESPHLALSGLVRDSSCRPLGDAVMEFWQADSEGEYDLRGNRFRGQLRTDAAGRYQLHTIEPGRYLNGATYRPAHIHVKVHANGHPPLTTQLYFPRDPHNESDPWFRSSLLIHRLRSGCHGRGRASRARFDFVL